MLRSFLRGQDMVMGMDMEMQAGDQVEGKDQSPKEGELTNGFE